MVRPVRPWPGHFFCHDFFTILCLSKSSVYFRITLSGHPLPLTTALRHYMAGPLFKSRLRPCRLHYFLKKFGYRIATNNGTFCCRNFVLTLELEHFSTGLSIVAICCLLRSTKVDMLWEINRRGESINDRGQFITLSVNFGWRRGLVVSGVRRMNKVNARRVRLVPGWVTVFGRVYHTSQLGQLSLRGRLIEYQLLLG